MYQVPVKFQAVGTTVNETDKDPALLNLMMSWLRHVKYHIHFFCYVIIFIGNMPQMH